MSGSDPMSSLNVSSDTIVPGGVGEVESVRSRSSSGASSRQRSRKKAQGIREQGYVTRILLDIVGQFCTQVLY